MYRSIIPPPLPPLISPGSAGLATAVVALLATGANWTTHIRHHERVSAVTPSVERVRYLLPLLPARVPVQAIHIEWVPDLSRVTGGDLTTARTAGAHEGDNPAAIHLPPIPRQAVEAPVFSDSEIVGGKVYIESELDQPVERDPGSGGPAYPSFLEQQRIEGNVTVSYIVDTTGLADSSSMTVKAVTHPAFAEAVRAALPGMHFRPAQLAGRPVRQLVIQEFRFVIRTPSDSLRRPIARAAFPGVAARDSGS
jgi:TonB family protein